MGKQSKKIRRLLAENDYLIAPCAYDALSARAIQASGFSIAGTTGYGMHGVVLGQPDTGLLALNETVSILSKMVDAVEDRKSTRLNSSHSDSSRMPSSA